MAADGGTNGANSTPSPGLRLRISCSANNLLAMGSDAGNISSCNSYSCNGSTATAGRYIVRGSPPVSPKQHSRSLAGNSSAGSECMLFSLAVSNSDPGYHGPGSTHSCNSSPVKPLMRAGSLIPSNYGGSSSSSSADASNRQLCAARTGSCYATRFKLAPQGSWFGSQALKPAGSSGSEVSGPALICSNSRSARESGTQKGKSQPTRYAASSSSSSKRAAPGSLMAMSSLSEALQLCPFSGDASAGAMMLATAGFARHDNCTNARQQLPQKLSAGNCKQAGQSAVQQQIEWK